MIETPANEKSVKFCRRWQKHRRHGVFVFVLLWGVLGWGVPMLALVYIGMPWLLSQDMAWPAYTDIVIYLSLGLIGGFHMWHIMESRFAKEASTCNFRSEDAKPDA